MVEKKNNCLIVTGLSGAGMSSALKHLEDMGYEAFDNFPMALVDPLLENSCAEKSPVAIGIDTRSRDFDPDLLADKVDLLQARLVFISSDEAVLQKRFTETRRRHPLAQDRPVSAGIKKEQELLFGLRERADLLIDTSQLSIHDLRRILEGHFAPEGRQNLTVTLMSFGFRYGLPREADIVMDVRFLSNPYWETALKSLTGRDQAVGDYIEKDENFSSFLTHFQALTEPLLPRYAHEGKSYLTIAIGCTGGRHRSVYTVERLKPWLESKDYGMNVLHRDIDR